MHCRLARRAPREKTMMYNCPATIAAAVATGDGAHGGYGTRGPVCIPEFQLSVCAHINMYLYVDYYELLL